MTKPFVKATIDELRKMSNKELMDYLRRYSYHLTTTQMPLNK